MMINDIVSGALHCEDLSISRLIAIPKGESLRPIAISECIVKLASSLAVTRCHDKLSEVLEHQHGLAVQGAETIIHATRRIFSSQKEPLFIVTLDASNAFGCVSRKAMADELYAHDELSPLWQIFYLNYGRPFPVIFDSQDKSFRGLSSSGGKQGDPCMSAAFCLALQQCLRKLVRSKNFEYFAFMDDITIIGTRSELTKQIPELIISLQSIGLSLNHKKCEVFGRKKDTSAMLASHLGFAHAQHSIKVLGAFIAEDQQLVSEALLQKVDSHKVFFNTLLDLPRPTAMKLLVLCGVPKWAFIARTHPQEATQLAHAKFDELVRDTACKILNVATLPQSAYLQQKDGGLGITAYTMIGNAAYSASVHPDSDCQAARVAVIQKSLKDTIFLDPTSKSILTASSKKHSNDWLSPSSGLTNESYCAALRFRLGCDIEKTKSTIVCECGMHSPTQHFLSHALGCTKSKRNGPTLRHSLLSSRFSDFLRNVGVTTRIEPCVEGRKRADLEIFIGSKTFLVDFTVFSSTSPSYKGTLAERTISQKEKKKKKHYGTEDLVVFTVEVCGGLSAAAESFVKFLSKEIGFDARDLFEVVGAAVQEGNGRILTYFGKLLAHLPYEAATPNGQFLQVTEEVVDEEVGEELE